MNTGCSQTFGSACNYNFCCTIKLLNKIKNKNQSGESISARNVWQKVSVLSDLFWQPKLVPLPKIVHPHAKLRIYTHAVLACTCTDNVLSNVAISKGSATSYKSCNRSRKSFINLKILNLYFQISPYILVFVSL